MKKIFNFYIKSEQLEALYALAKEPGGLSVAAHIRMAIAAYLHDKDV